MVNLMFIKIFCKRLGDGCGKFVILRAQRVFRGYIQSIELCLVVVVLWSVVQQSIVIIFLI